MLFPLGLTRKKPSEPKRGVSDLHNELPTLGAVLRILESTALIRPFYEGGGCIQRVNYRQGRSPSAGGKTFEFDLVLSRLLRETILRKLPVRPPTYLSPTDEHHASIVRA